MKLIVEKLHSLMFLKEINKTCKIVYWTLVFGFLTSFNSWISMERFTSSAHLSGMSICPEYFQACSKLIFFDSLPNSYGQALFYTLILAFITCSAIAALKNKYSTAFMLLIPPTLFQVLAVFLLANRIFTSFVYFHLTFVIILLFLPNKVNLLKISICLLYFFSGLIKIHSGWVLGTNFSSLTLGMPIFADFLIPFLTNGVIFLELFFTFFLISKNKKYVRTVAIVYLIFHVYSAALIGYRFPIHCLPMIIALFIIDDEQFKFPLITKKTILSYLFLLLITVFHLIPYTIKGDEKITHEGIRLSISMYDANRQCSSKTSYIYTNKTSSSKTVNSKYSSRRCVPYTWWSRLKRECNNTDISKIMWQYDISINGEPFKRVIDTKNVCELEFNPFQHNEWIDPDGRVVGYPKKNSTKGMSYDRSKPIIYNKESIHLTPLQSFLKNNLAPIKFFYIILALISFGYFFIFRLVRDHRKE